MPPIRRAEILSKQRVYDGFFKIDEVKLRYENYKGQLTTPKPRFVFERGDAAAGLVHQLDTDTLFFAEQLRAATVEKGPGWLLELPAGIVEPGEPPEQTIIREVEEEIGYRVYMPRLISVFYPSPGGSSERIYLYYCSVTTRDHVSAGGGLAREGEDIKTISLSRAQAMEGLNTGRFIDAKTVIGLQWLQNPDNLRKKDG